MPPSAEPCPGTTDPDALAELSGQLRRIFRRAGFVRGIACLSEADVGVVDAGRPVTSCRQWIERVEGTERDRNKVREGVVLCSRLIAKREAPDLIGICIALDDGSGHPIQQMRLANAVAP